MLSRAGLAQASTYYINLNNHPQSTYNLIVTLENTT